MAPLEKLNAVDSLWETPIPIKRPSLTSILKPQSSLNQTTNKSSQKVLISYTPRSKPPSVSRSPLWSCRHLPSLTSRLFISKRNCRILLTRPCWQPFLILLSNRSNSHKWMRAPILTKMLIQAVMTTFNKKALRKRQMKSRKLTKQTSWCVSPFRTRTTS